MNVTTEKTIKTTFKLKRGDAANWTETNPVLQAGEPGFELDTGKLKIGDGSKSWDELDYIGGTGSGESGESSTAASVIIDYPFPEFMMEQAPIKHAQFELNEPFPLSWAELKALIDAKQIPILKIHYTIDDFTPIEGYLQYNGHFQEGPDDEVQFYFIGYMQGIPIIFYFSEENNEKQGMAIWLESLEDEGDSTTYTQIFTNNDKSNFTEVEDNTLPEGLHKYECNSYNSEKNKYFNIDRQLILNGTILTCQGMFGSGHKLIFTSNNLSYNNGTWTGSGNAVIAEKAHSNGTKIIIITDTELNQMASFNLIVKNFKNEEEEFVIYGHLTKVNEDKPVASAIMFDYHENNGLLESQYEKGKRLKARLANDDLSIIADLNLDCVNGNKFYFTGVIKDKNSYLAQLELIDELAPCGYSPVASLDLTFLNKDYEYDTLFTIDNIKTTEQSVEQGYIVFVTDTTIIDKVQHGMQLYLNNIGHPFTEIINDFASPFTKTYGINYNASTGQPVSGNQYFLLLVRVESNDPQLALVSNQSLAGTLTTATILYKNEGYAPIWTDKTIEQIWTRTIYTDEANVDFTPKYGTDSDERLPGYYINYYQSSLSQNEYNTIRAMMFDNTKQYYYKDPTMPLNYFFIPDNLMPLDVFYYNFSSLTKKKFDETKPLFLLLISEYNSNYFLTFYSDDGIWADHQTIKIYAGELITNKPTYEFGFVAQSNGSSWDVTPNEGATYAAIAKALSETPNVYAKIHMASSEIIDLTTQFEVNYGGMLMGTALMPMGTGLAAMTLSCFNSGGQDSFDFQVNSIALS